MRWLFFLSRLAFICNILFCVCVSLQMFGWLHNPMLESYIIIIGFILGMLFNPLVNICYLFMKLIGKKVAPNVPVWLVTANIMFLLVQIFFIFYLNDKYHTQG